MQIDSMPDLDEAGRAAMHRREVVATWIFGLFLVSGMAALAIYGVLS